MKYKVTIIVEGSAGTGKSTIAKAIRNILVENKIDTFIDDPDIIVTWCEPESGTNLQYLSGNVEVNIKVVQTARESS